MNKLGKLLVFLHLLISVLAMSWAAAIFLQFMDWGWKEPRQYLDERVPSEFDKRAAALAEAQRAYATLAPKVVPAQIALANAEKRFPQNHLFYVAELDGLRNSTAPKLDIKEVKMVDGIAALDIPVIGRPVLEALAPVNKSYKMYLADYYAVQAQIAKVSKDIQDVQKAENALSLRLSGVDDKPGLYKLADIEKAKQDEIKSQKEYIQPQWVSALRQVAVYKDRQARLEATLGKLKGK